MVVNYFTFGCGQTFKNHYVVIKAKDSNRCRELMVDAFGTNWSMQYDKEPDGKWGEKPLVHIVESEHGSKVIHVLPAEIHHV